MPAPDRSDACARVLARLRQNFRGWVSTPEINRVGGWRATARIYDLRRAGFAIAGRKAAGQEFNEYCLLDLFPGKGPYRPAVKVREAAPEKAEPVQVGLFALSGKSE